MLPVASVEQVYIIGLSSSFPYSLAKPERFYPALLTTTTPLEICHLLTNSVVDVERFDLILLPPASSGSSVVVSRLRCQTIRACELLFTILFDRIYL